MKLPWSTEEKDQKIKQLEDKIEELEDEKQSLEEQLKAEQGRRRELSRKKQSAEEELNKLKDRVRNLEKQDEEETETREQVDYRSLSFSQFENLLEKLDSIESPEKELVTVYTSEDVFEVERELKNSVDSETFTQLSGIGKFAGFIDEQLGVYILKTHIPHTAGVELGQGFDISQVKDFVDKKKHFVTVSAGESKIYREQGGEYEQVESITSRVDHEHSQGGFSQGRFERKRDEQVRNHLEEVEERLQDKEDIYLLGEKRLCKELPGTRLTGFDPNKPVLQQFYGPRFTRL